MSNKLNQVTRYGSYGIITYDTEILLTQKKSGPYCGLWDLPGGGIEFGENPDATVIREIREETAIIVDSLKFFDVASAVREYVQDGILYHFHHVGLLYQILNWTQASHLIPEEEARWVYLYKSMLGELTPFARHAVTKLTNIKP